MTGAGTENGAELARKSNERERDLKNYGGAEREREARGSGAEQERNGERAE